MNSATVKHDKPRRSRNGRRSGRRPRHGGGKGAMSAKRTRRGRRPADKAKPVSRGGRPQVPATDRGPAVLARVHHAAVAMVGEAPPSGPLLENRVPAPRLWQMLWRWSVFVLAAALVLSGAFALVGGAMFLLGSAAMALATAVAALIDALVSLLLTIMFFGGIILFFAAICAGGKR